MGRANSLTPANLQEIMIRAQINEVDLGGTLNITTKTVSRWLGGEVFIPGYVEAYLKEKYPEIYESVLYANQADI